MTHWMLSRKIFLCLLAPPFPSPFPPLPRPDIMYVFGWWLVGCGRARRVVVWIRKKRREGGGLSPSLYV